MNAGELQVEEGNIFGSGFRKVPKFQGSRVSEFQGSN
jgi:hypothetical protein